MKIDYGESVEFVATSNFSVTYEFRLYRNGTLIHTRITNRVGTASGTNRIPIADTYVDTTPVVGLNTYQLRVIVTAATNITTLTVINRNMNIIQF